LLPIHNLINRVFALTLTLEPWNASGDSASLTLPLHQQMLRRRNSDFGSDPSPVLACLCVVVWAKQLVIVVALRCILCSAPRFARGFDYLRRGLV